MSSCCSDSLGVGTAVPLMVADMAFGRMNLRAIGSTVAIGPAKSRFGLVTGSLKLSTGAARAGPENAASSSLGSCIAGWKVNPGIATSVIPAPWGGFAGLLLGRVASMVILRCSVFPGATETLTGAIPHWNVPADRSSIRCDGHPLDTRTLCRVV